ncbi:hypothetical protein BJX96DRAFT_146901 [Aspergillus floccosus]
MGPPHAHQRRSLRPWKCTLSLGCNCHSGGRRVYPPELSMIDADGAPGAEARAYNRRRTGSQGRYLGLGACTLHIPQLIADSRCCRKTIDPLTLHPANNSTVILLSYWRQGLTSGGLGIVCIPQGRNIPANTPGPHSSTNRLSARRAAWRPQTSKWYV